MVLIVLDMVQAARQGYDHCRGLTEKEIMDYLYSRLNADGKKCVDDGQVYYADFLTFMEELTRGEMTLDEFANRLADLLKRMPPLVHTCEKARIDL